MRTARLRAAVRRAVSTRLDAHAIGLLAQAESSMSWLQKLLPPRIKSTPGAKKTAVPEGLWVKCPSCEAVLYRTDLEKNLEVCPKCAHHARVGARIRIDQLLDPEGRYEIGSEVLPVDSLKF